MRDGGTRVADADENLSFQDHSGVVPALRSGYCQADFNLDEGFPEIERGKPAWHTVAMARDLPPSHVQWLLDRRGPALSARLTAEGARLSPEEALRVLMACDPSPRKVATQWLCDAYLARGFLWEDAAAGADSKAAETLRLFAAHRTRLVGTGRNLSSYPGLASLHKAVKPFLEAPDAEGSAPSGKALRRAKREAALSESVVIHRADDLVVAVPLTEAASRWWGRGTRWCTAADKNNAFISYNRTAPLVVMILPGRTPGEPVRKWQMHVAVRRLQLMDKDDAWVSGAAVEAEWDRVGGVFLWAAGRSHQGLKMVPEAFRTAEMCLEAVRQNGRALQYVPDDLQTAETSLEAVRQDGLALEYVPLTLRISEMCLESVRQNGRALYYVPRTLRTAEMCLEAVRRNGEALRYVSRNLQTAEMCLEAVRQNGMALDDALLTLRTAEVCLEAVRQNGLALRYVPGNLQTEEICLEAVRQDGMALAYVSLTLRTAEVFLEAVRQNGEALRYVPRNLLTSEICLEAVRQNGEALEYVPRNLMTAELCLEAVRQNGEALEYVPIEYRNPDLLSEARQISSDAAFGTHLWRMDILDGLAAFIRDNPGRELKALTTVPW